MSLPVLKKGTVNQNIALTLTEKTTISNPTYLFEFESDQTKLKYYVISTDTSVAKQRINIFSIEEGIDNPTNGQLILGPVGFYQYKIYAQTSTTNLDPDLSDEMVEQGKMKLIESDDITTGFVQHEIDVTYRVHEVQ